MILKLYYNLIRLINENIWGGGKLDNHLLIQMAKDGCNISFEKLIKMNGEKIYRVAYYYVKNEAMALDVVSEATYKAYRDIKKLKDIRYFNTWLIKIVINEAINVLRKEKKYTHFENYNKEINIDTYENIEEKTDLYMALDKLKKDEKEILVLRYFADLTFADIAKVMRRPENSIKTRHYRALNKIKTILQGERA